MDKAVMEQWDAQVRLEERQEEERTQSFQGVPWGNGTEENIGESYLT